MDDETDNSGGVADWFRARLHIFISTAGLIAWIAMLWFMFGDVL